MEQDQDDEPHCLDESPIVMAPSTDDEVLFPPTESRDEPKDRTESLGANSLSLSLEKYIEMGRQAFNPSPRPLDLICCSLISSGHPGSCV